MNEKQLYRFLKSREECFSVSELGCGMEVYKEVVDGYWRTRFLLNNDGQTAYEIVGRDLLLKSFTADDVDASVFRSRHLRYAHNALRLAAHYPFAIYPFKDGMACVEWTLHPDGMYFCDNDGYGMEPCEEEAIVAYIDTECRVLTKFRDVADEQESAWLHNQALSVIGRL